MKSGLLNLPPSSSFPLPQRNLLVFFLLACLLFSKGDAQPLNIEIRAPAALLMNAKTGAILFQKNGEKAFYPASIVKIATAAFILEKKRDFLHEIVVAKQEAIASITPQAKKQSNYRAPAYWLETDGSHIGIKKGEEFQLQDLLYALLVTSANDAANVVAQSISGTIPKFMEELNAYLKSIGCKNTHFLNPHGLPHPAQMTTPYDMALITKRALENPLFREIVSVPSYKFPETNLAPERLLNQTNQLLRRGKYYYPKAIGVKTGTSSQAGKNLVAAAEENGRCLIAVLMGCEGNADRYEDAIKMFNAAFEEPKLRRTLFPAGNQTLTKKVIGAKGVLKTFLTEGLAYDFYPSEEVVAKGTIKWSLPPLPIEKGSYVGIVRITDEKGNVLQEAPLLAAESLKPTFFYRLKLFITTSRKLVFGVIALATCLCTWKLRRYFMR